MTRKKSEQSSSSPRSVAGALATGLTALANGMILKTALSADGALRRTLQIQPLRMSAAMLLLCSRMNLGHWLRLAWKIERYHTGFRRITTAAHIGDSWRQFANGRFELRPPSKR